MSDFYERVYQAVKQIPEGKVSTYGDVARAIGAPRCARQVGWALHVNPYQGTVPCHRVIFADGRLSYGFAFGGIEIQRELLAKEGVEVSADFKVNLNRFRFEFDF